MKAIDDTILTQNQAQGLIEIKIKIKKFKV